jgi:predicted membrane-bound dolichyl-phosphate-mannose-protein mannosyltransferase
MSVSFKRFMEHHRETKEDNDWGWFVDIEVKDEPIIFTPRAYSKPTYNVKLLETINSITTLEQLEKRYYGSRDSLWSFNSTCIISIIVFVVLAL